MCSSANASCCQCDESAPMSWRNLMKVMPLMAGILLAAGATVRAVDQALERTDPPGVSKPQTYSHVVRAGNLLFVAGQVGFDADGKLVGPGMSEQYEQLLKNMKTVLASQGADFSHIAKITVFVTSIDEFRGADMSEIRAKYFGDVRPASTLVQVVRLAEPEIKIEIEAVAALP
ncbi:MAG: reactive intermediate/imine deaminase [Luteitalea sp.]|nr:reactive intermediate/imine deaminase [Luteitalea sp.]